MPTDPLKQHQEKAQLPGKLSMVRISRGAATPDGGSDEEAMVVLKNMRFDADGPDEVALIHQEGYGLWPSCESCGEQVEPSSFAAHANSHDPNSRGG